MAENVFEAVKQSVSTRDAAAFYGIEVKRNGMACCPFHDDKNPSMKLNEEYFYCFGCGATGDVIDFTAKLFDLSPKEAAEKLAQDFGLIYDSQAPPRRRYVRQKTEAQQFREDRQRCYRVLSDYYHYCDSVGFTQIPGFLPQNPLKNAEMAMEDDYGMIDGIINNGPKEPTVAELEQQARSGQPISLMDLTDAIHRKEREKKKSVMEQLKSQPKAEHKKTAQKKSAESLMV